MNDISNNSNNFITQEKNINSNQSIAETQNSTTLSKEQEINNVKNNDNVDEKRFPYAIVIIIIVLFSSFIVYYFLWITPAKVFDNAINNAVDTIKSVLTNVKENEHDTARININTILHTSGPTLKKDKSIGYLDGLKVGSTIDVDIRNFNLGVKFFSDLKNISNKMKYGEELNIAFDYIDENMYINMDSKVAKYTTENDNESMFLLNYEKIDNAIEVFEKVKDQVIDLVDNEKLERKITTKKVSNQTAIAIKVSTKLNNQEISEIWDKGFTNLYQDSEFINKLADVLGITSDEVKELIETDIIKNHVVQTNNITVNLYMNLANTKLIGLDVTVDKYYVEINYLNGYYYIDIKVNDVKNGKIIPNKYVLDIVTTYDNVKGKLLLTGIAELENKTYLEVDTEYMRKTSDDSNKMVGNTLNFKFYDEDVINSGRKGDKPFCTLDCTLDLTYDERNIELINPEKSVDLISLNNDEISKLKYMIEKITYEYKVVYGRLLLNRKDKTYIEKYLEDSLKESHDSVNKLFSKSIGSVTYEQIAVASIQDFEDKISSIESMNEEQKDKVYNLLIESISDSLSYNEIINMDKNIIKDLMNKIKMLPVEKQKYIYKNMSDTIINNINTSSIVNLSKENITKLSEKIVLLPKEVQNSIYDQIVVSSKDLILNISKYDISMDELIEKVKLWPDNVSRKILN